MMQLNKTGINFKVSQESHKNEYFNWILIAPPLIHVS